MLDQSKQLKCMSVIIYDELILVVTFGLSGRW